MLSAIKTRWNNRFRNPKRLFPTQKHIIKYAFSVAGVDYFQFDDVFNLPYERGLAALAIYEETRTRCSREYLTKHVEALRSLLHAKEIDIFRINQLNEQMNERLNLTFDTDLLYKLASVVFFDKNESPVLYEPEYCEKKIDFWRKNRGVADFFLQKPLQELIPFLRSVNFDLNEYSALNTQLNKIHSDNLSSCCSNETSTDRSE